MFVALKDLDLGRRRRARHVLDQLGERHPVGRRGERVRLLAHKVAVHEVAFLVTAYDRERSRKRILSSSDF